MADEPYRPRPAESTDLSRLAAEGQRRILEAKARDASLQRGPGERSRERNVRVALGGHYGAPVWTASYVLLAAGVAMLAAGLLFNPVSVAVLFLVPLGAVLLRAFAPPTATRARVAAERAWLTALPFPVDGYFETLAATPAFRVRLVIEVTWSGEGRCPGEDVLRGILGIVDTDARVEKYEGSRVCIRSGDVWCGTRVRLNRAAITRNTRIVSYVHDLMDTTVLPLHRDCPIARVSIARG
jgi:hypothetical protein